MSYQFKYQGLDKAGARVAGICDADSEQEAVKQLFADGIMVSTVAVQSDSGARRLNLRSSSVSSTQLEEFTTEIAILLSRGVRIDRAMEVSRKGEERNRLNAIVSELSANLRSGMQLSEAASKYPDVFDSLFISLVKAGEVSGRLDFAFTQLSESLKYRNELRRDVIQAITYPSVILCVCIVSIFFVFNYIVPQMRPLFEGAQSLPVYTSMLLAVGDWFVRYQMAFALLVLGLLIALPRALKRPTAKQKILKFISRWPLIGPLLIRTDSVRVNSALAMTMSAGVSIDEALGLAAKSVSNPDIIAELKAAQSKIRGGETIRRSLSKSELYPDFAISLIEVGEETGDLVASFSEITSRSRSEFESTVKQITSLLEPLLILLMGGIVGAVVVVMLLSVVAVNDVAI